MMGLLGNVAEVKELRPQLMNQTFISLFDELLESPSDGIEVCACTLDYGHNEGRFPLSAYSCDPGSLSDLIST